jgi:hypothetical protein
MIDTCSRLRAVVIFIVLPVVLLRFESGGLPFSDPYIVLSPKFEKNETLRLPFCRVFFVN